MGRYIYMSHAFKTRTVLLDAHAIIHRAYHAMPDFSTRDGRPTGGLYGVCTMLLKIIEDLQPDYIVACYDLPKPTFRHVAYDHYKGGRRESDEALKTQLASSRDIFTAFNIPIYDLEGYEADDILGTIAEEIKKEASHEVIIASGDMDTLQLVEGDQVKVFTPQKGLQDVVMYTEEAVVARYGFASDLIPDFKGLAGDSSDNIKGVPGIGLKTATHLITHYGTVEEILAAIEADEGGVIQSGVTQRMVGLVREGAEDALFSKELATIKRDVPLRYTPPPQSFREGVDLSVAGEIFRRYEFRTMMSKLQKVLGVTDLAQESFFAGESEIDPDRLEEAKLGVYLLNPILADPTLDDVRRYGEDFETAMTEIRQDIQKEELDFVWREIECATIQAVRLMNQTGFSIDQGRLKALSKKFHKKIDVLEEHIYGEAGQTFNIKSTQQLSRVLFEDLALPTKGIKKTPKGLLSTQESELRKLSPHHPIIPLILEYRELTKLTSTYLDNILPLVSQETGRLYSTFVPTGTTTGRMASRDPNLQNIPVGGEYGKEIRTMFVPQEGFTLLSCDYSQIELRMAAQLSRDEKFLRYFKSGRDIHTAVAQEIFGEENQENRRRAKVINFGILYGMGARALRTTLGAQEYTLAQAQEYLDQYFERFPTLAGYLEATKCFARDHHYTQTLFGRRRYFADMQSHIPFIKAAAERMAINAPIQGTATADIIKLALRDCWEYLEEHSVHDEVHLLAQVHDELVFEVKDGVLEKHQKQLVRVMEEVLEKYAPRVNQEALVSLVVDATVGGQWAETK